MNRTMWFLVVFLGLCAIALGLLLGYVNSQQPESSALSLAEEPSQTVEFQKKVDEQAENLTDKLEVEQGEKPEYIDEMELPEERYILDQYAIDSMADARLNGDDRAPPIGQSVESERPTNEELESPELYLEYESRQEKKLYKAYIEAADIKIEMLEAQITKAKEQGLSKEELEVGIEKVKRIKNMKEQLLLENPDLQ